MDAIHTCTTRGDHELLPASHFASCETKGSTANRSYVHVSDMLCDGVKLNMLGGVDVNILASVRPRGVWSIM